MDTYIYAFFCVIAHATPTLPPALACTSAGGQTFKTNARLPHICTGDPAPLVQPGALLWRRPTSRRTPNAGEHFVGKI